MSDFHLLGHDCPYGRYPAPVIPVGRLANGNLVAVYPGGKTGPTWEEVEGSEYVINGSLSGAELETFDWRTDRLFAFAPQQVERYATANEPEYLQNVLARPELRNTDAFLRLMLAKQTGRRSLITREIHSCYAQLKARDVKSADEWRKSELARVPEEVFIACSSELRNSPVVSILRAVIGAIEGTSPIEIPWQSDGTRDLREVENRIREAAVFAEVTGSDGEEAGIAPAVTYERGLAVGLKKPTLLVSHSAETAHFDRERDAFVPYDHHSIHDETARERLASRLMIAIKSLKERASQIATPAGGPVMENVFELARDVRQEGRVLARLLGKLLQNASDSFAVFQSPEFKEDWGEYERLHVNRMAHYLNGKASQTQHALAGFLESAPETLRQLGQNFYDFRSAMLSYEDAFRAAKGSVGVADRGGLLSIIGPLDQTLHNLNDGADKIITEMVATMLPWCTAQSPANESKYRIAKA